MLTDRVADEAFRDDLPRLMDAVSERITFGVGGMDGAAREHPIHDDPRWRDVPGWVRGLRGKARGQLGTVGGGNHYVNLMADELDRVWVCDHFGPAVSATRSPRGSSTSPRATPPARATGTTWTRRPS